MSITSTKKFEKFQSVPLKECGLRDVPGVGEVAENKLKDANIDDACKIIGHFLLLGRDTEKMTQWLKDVCEIQEQYGKKISEALAEKADKLVAI